MKFKKIIFGALSLSVMVNPLYVFADEITVSGNGEGSTNNVNVASTQNTQTTQTNNAEVNNNVNLNASTGNNTANENNGGETTITTGDVNASSEIVNAGINQSYSETGCCSGELGINVSGNGSGSNNSAGYSSTGNTNISINNNANIYNSVHGDANTGYNQANKNNGNVSISTGSIYATDTIKNTSINIYDVQAAVGNGGSVYISINDNGADSENSVAYVNDSNVEINAENSANIVNNSHWDLNTGGNEASKNNGDVEIETGDIVFASTIENTDINVGIVDVECCEDDNGTPPDGNPPPSNPSTNNNGSGGTSGNGSSSGGSTPSQTVLPITGGPSLLFLLIVNSVMFFMGWYLRLRSGRSPNLAV